MEPPSDVWSFTASGSDVFYENLEVDRGAVKFGGISSGLLGSLAGLARRICLEYGPDAVSPGPFIWNPKQRRLFNASRPGVSLYRPGALAISRNARRRFWSAGKVIHLEDAG